VEYNIEKNATNLRSHLLNVRESNKFFEIQIWRVDDVAEYLGVTPGHIYNLCHRREIPFVKKGKLLYFIHKEIENWVLQGN
jgi:excisionase family DNA binding protein